MYTATRRGPRTEPWGTPNERNVTHEEELPPGTIWGRFARYTDSRDGSNPVMPRLAWIMVPVMWHCFTLIVDDAIVSFSEQLIMRHCLRCSDEMMIITLFQTAN